MPEGWSRESFLGEVMSELRLTQEEKWEQMMDRRCSRQKEAIAKAWRSEGTFYV